MKKSLHFKWVMKHRDYRDPVRRSIPFYIKRNDMTTKILKDVKINGYRIFFGKINEKYVIAMPDVGISGYMDPLLPEFLQDNIIKLSNLFKSRGFRNITLSHLIIHTVTELFKNDEEERIIDQ